MSFEYTERTKQLMAQLTAFMARHIWPNVKTYDEQCANLAEWPVPPIMEELKVKARAAGLWNLFMPPWHSGARRRDVPFRRPVLTNWSTRRSRNHGPSRFASEVFNCSAPDTGNMEVLQRYGTRAQKDLWLAPLMRGESALGFPDDGTEVRLLGCEEHRDLDQS